MIRSREQGVALIQVLLLTTIMSVIAIQFTKTARIQVNTAKDFRDKIQAELMLKTAETAVLFELFQNDAYQIPGKNINGVAWQLGRSFNLNRTTSVEIMPLNSSLSLTTAPEMYVKTALLASGVEPENVQGTYNAIADWIDVNNFERRGGAEANAYAEVKPRNGPMQDLTELMAVKGMTASIYEKFNKMVTIYTTPSFNPSFASDELIKALFNEDIAEQLLEIKIQQGAINQDSWQRIAGGRFFEFIDFDPDIQHRVTIRTKVGDVSATETLYVRSQNQNYLSPMVILARY